MRLSKLCNALLCAVLLSTGACADSKRPAETVLIRNVHVLTMEDDSVLRNHAVLIRGQRIAAVAESATLQAPAGTRVIEGDGRYLLPGLAEMHGHIPGAKESEAYVERFFWLNVVNGVTTVRGMLGDDIQLEWRRQIARGERVGPQLFLAGNSINGQTVTSLDQAWQRVTQQRAAGYDLLKIHPGLSWKHFQAVAATARAENILFGGHVPTDVGLERALEQGMSSVEHLDGYIHYLAGEQSSADFWGTSLVDQADIAGIPTIIEKTRLANAWVTPTNTLFETFLGTESVEDMLKRPQLAYWPKKNVDIWTEQVTQYRQQTAETVAQRDEVLALRGLLIRDMQRADVGILLGADAPQIFNVPGFATLRELENMVAVGLTAFEALQAGTVNPARYFGLENAFGKIKPGMRADLVLVDDNPLDNIGNMRRISGVGIAGRWISKPEIDKKLASLKTTR